MTGSWPDTFERIALAQEWRILARIDVGAKIVTRNASSFLDCEDVLGREGFHTGNPLPNGLLRHATKSAHGRLTADNANGFSQCNNWR